MENLRSALDYVAHGLFHKYGMSNKKDAKIYFPYAFLSKSKADFFAQKNIERCIPGISRNKKVVDILESYQHFSKPENRWLPIFMDLNNHNKHRSLTPQKRKETKQLNISSGGTSIRMGEGTSIRMGKGTSIQMGNMIIPGGQQIDVNNPPITQGSGKVEIIKWVSFHFSSNNEPVLPLLEHSLNGVEKIVNELSKI